MCPPEGRRKLLLENGMARLIAVILIILVVMISAAAVVLMRPTKHVSISILRDSVDIFGFIPPLPKISNPQYPWEQVRPSAMDDTEPTDEDQTDETEGVSNTAESFDANLRDTRAAPNAELRTALEQARADLVVAGVELERGMITYQIAFNISQNAHKAAARTLNFAALRTISEDVVRKADSLITDIRNACQTEQRVQHARGEAISVCPQ